MADRNRLESGRRETYRGFESRPLCQTAQWSTRRLSGLPNGPVVYPMAQWSIGWTTQTRPTRGQLRLD